MYIQNGIWCLKVVFLTAKLPSKGHQALPVSRRERRAQVDTRHIALRSFLEA